MARYVNHLVDPTFFYAAIEEFAFDYDLYYVSGKGMDDYGRITNEYTRTTIRGSLQTQGLTHEHSLEGSRDVMKYNFYCKSLYRINKEDFIYYKGNWLKVDSVHEYDEWGVRECSLEMVDLAAYRDLADYVAYINGEKTI